MGIEKRARPKRLVGSTTKVNTGCGNVYITVTRDQVGMFEVFATLGKAGGCTIAVLEGLSRSITLGLRYGISPDEFIKQLQHIECPKAIWEDGVRVLSCVDAIAKVMSENHNEDTDKVVAKVPSNPKPSSVAVGKTTTNMKPIICPECGERAIFQEGCVKCLGCGWSECS